MLYYFTGSRENAMTLWYQLPLGDFHDSRRREYEPPQPFKRSSLHTCITLPPSHSAFLNAAKFGLAGQRPPPPPLEREAQRARMEKARQPRSVRSGLAFRLSLVGGFFSGFSVRGLGEMNEADGP